MRDRRIDRLAVLLLILLISTVSVATIHAANAQSTQTCTTTTCEAIQPTVVVVGYGAVQSDPEPPVFGGLMYVANTGSDTVSVLMNTTNIANITVGASPTEPIYDDFHGLLYVPNTGGDTVSVISGSGLDATVNVGQAPVTPAFDPANEDVYVPNSGGCTVAFTGTSCGDTVSVISGTTVVANVTVGGGPATPAVNTDSGSPYYGYVYVPNTVVGSDGNATISVISPMTNKVVATIGIGFAPAGGAFFDSHDDEVYAADTIISGTKIVGETTAPCNADCVYDPYNGLIYTPADGYPPVLDENGSSEAINCVSCGGDPVFDPTNGWVYWGGYAVSGTTPFGVLSGGPTLGPDSFSPIYGSVYGSCGGCYYFNSAGHEVSGDVVYVFSGVCSGLAPGYYYTEPASSICSGATGAGLQSTSTATVNPLPNVLGSHVFSVVIGGGVAIGYGSFNAFSATDVVGNTQWQYVGVSFKITGPDGQSGWTTLSIPKAKAAQLVTLASLGGLVSGSMDQWKVTVFFDGVPVQSYVQFDDNNVYVSFPCHFSNHTVGVVLAEPGAPQPLNFSSNSTAVSMTYASATASSTVTSSSSSTTQASSTTLSSVVSTSESSTSTQSSVASSSTSSTGSSATSSASSVALQSSAVGLVALNVGLVMALAFGARLGRGSSGR